MGTGGTWKGIPNGVRLGAEGVELSEGLSPWKPLKGKIQLPARVAEGALLRKA